MPMTEHECYIADQVYQFRAATGLSGRPAHDAVPTTWRMVPPADLERVAARGEVALTALCARLSAATAAQVVICVLLLAVLPRVVSLLSCEDVGRSIDPELVADLATFAIAILGYNPGRRLQIRPRLLKLLPPEWREAIGAAAQITRDRSDGAAALGGCERPDNAVLRLALLAIVGGAWTPDALSPAVTLVELERASGWDLTLGRAWRRGLRSCIDAVPSEPAGAAREADASARGPLGRVVAYLIASGFAQMRSAPRGLRHVLIARGHTVQRAEYDAKGKVVVPPELAAVAAELDNAEREILLLLEAHAPFLAELVTCERVGGRNPGLVRPTTSGNVLRTLDRLAAQYVECEAVLKPLLESRGEQWYPLCDVTPIYFLSQLVPARLLHVLPPIVKHAKSVTRGMAQARVVLKDPEPQVPLVFYLIDRQAPASWANSPEGASGAPLAGYTQTLLKDARDFTHAYCRWVATATPRTEPHVSVNAELRVKAQIMIDTIELRTAEAGTFKDVAKLLTLVTWPLLVGPGLEHLRRAVWARYAAISRAASVRPPEDHPDFVSLLESYVVLARFCVDPLRFRNAREDRIGREIRLSIDRRDPGARLLSVTSEITGKRIKQGRRWKEGRRRTQSAGRARIRGRRTHRWSPYLIDLDLLWMYLTHVRRRRLPASDPGARPMFLREDRSGEPLSDDTIRDRFARALHMVCVEALGCDLPPWDEFDRVRREEWFALFSPHVVRSLVVIYWWVVREHGHVGDELPEYLRSLLAAQRPAPGIERVLDMDTDQYVMHLTTDTRQTIERVYTKRPEWMLEALEEPVESWSGDERWRHPRALDPLVDLISCATTRVVDIPWGDYPLPPRCQWFAERHT